ncbi:hypothetical protein [Bradyrhizobium sp. BR13661]|uniref:hypothetical protein n=1 Tax=Bradyrhizobium sp. BR13661 TaxID=2940622 RepID=UPI0024753F68|nr:hypothetical protein [Bradyrhizobium sp. BR13661]MDH6263376.1 hypothetical protein [Bradyrhizobium sp. BR13661]
MAKDVHFDVIRKLIVVSVLLGSTSAQAENCKQFPPGPFRRQCAEANHPQLGAKLERCKEEAGSMGLYPGKGDPDALKEYVQACMHRR